MPEADTEAALQLTDDILSLSIADQTEIRLGGGRLHVARFAHNALVDNVEERWLRAQVKLGFIHRRDAWRFGEASTTDLSEDGLIRLLENARDAADLNTPIRDWLPCPFPDEFESSLPDVGSSFDQQTATAGPALIANQVASIVIPCIREGFEAFGHYSVSVGTIALSGEPALSCVANSNGLFHAYQPTAVHLLASVVAPSGGSATVFGDAVGLEGIELERAVQTAIERAALPKRMALSLGESCAAVLEPRAVATLLEALRPHLSWYLVDRRQSVFRNQLGEPLFGSGFHLSANPTHELLAGCPFDREGWPCRALNLFDAGTLSTYLYSRAEALSRNLEPNGYLSENTHFEAAVPDYLVLAGGEMETTDLLSELGSGVLIPDMVGVELNRDLELTASTSDGALFFEGGQLINQLPDFSFRIGLRDFLDENLLLGGQRRVGRHVAASLAGQGLEVTSS